MTLAALEKQDDSSNIYPYCVPSLDLADLSLLFQNDAHLP
jgi:hypothetical protein